MIVTERMVAAALIAEAHQPPGIDQMTMARNQMRASLMAALAVMPIEDETAEEKLAREIGEAILEYMYAHPEKFGTTLIVDDSAASTETTT
jgi:hypothetical protein